MIDAALFAITQDQRTMGERPRATRLTAGSAGAGSARVLSQQVVDRILELVRNGNLKPGDRLPPERELIDIFSISRPSLREALRSLSTLGVVEAQHGGGAYISDLNAKTMLAPLDFYLSLSKSSIKDTFESRRLIEVDLARRSAALATREDVSEFETMMAAHAAVLHDAIGFRILDSRFHEKLYRTAGNVILHRMADSLYNMGLELHRQATAEAGAIPQSIEDHRAIVDAIRQHDPDAAGAAMLEHLNNIEASTLRIMESA